MITHEQHEANSAAWSGVNTTEDVSTYLRIFFPAITDDVINKLLELYPESEYSSPGLRFSDMKQSFDLTAHNLAVTQALGNKTWNAMVALGAATHGTNQNYYCKNHRFSFSSFRPINRVLAIQLDEQGIARTRSPPRPAPQEALETQAQTPLPALQVVVWVPGPAAPP